MIHGKKGNEKKTTEIWATTYEKWATENRATYRKVS